MTAETPDRPRPVDAGQPSDRRAAVLAMLRAADRPLEITEIAAELGIHRNTARFHLDNLVDAGQVARTTGPPTKQGRPPQLFQIASGWDPLGPRQYRVLAETLLEHLRAQPDPRGAALDAGHRLGTRLGAEPPTATPPDRSGGVRGADGMSGLRRLTTELDSLGFRPSSPRRTRDEIAVDLGHCPFQELSAHPDQLVCHIHRGMLHGALEAWQEPLELAALDPLVEPGRCVVRLRPRD